ncbi:hypothetical protein PIB30_016843 [Stylosanthes scabra]|uniref:Ubiquitin-like protease family profile domain-containing protein n=1 Tax=Stylosanthes scabra TaxID=79078 RepID=A0ABU6T7A0_9FABA|nr:hypothetical protein [Stylosanthes scabra]
MEQPDAIEVNSLDETSLGDDVLNTDARRLHKYSFERGVEPQSDRNTEDATNQSFNDMLLDLLRQILNTLQGLQNRQLSVEQEASIIRKEVQNIQLSIERIEQALVNFRSLPAKEIIGCTPRSMDMEINKDLSVGNEMSSNTMKKRMHPERLYDQDNDVLTNLFDDEDKQEGSDKSNKPNANVSTLQASQASAKMAADFFHKFRAQSMPSQSSRYPTPSGPRVKIPTSAHKSVANGHVTRQTEKSGPKVPTARGMNIGINQHGKISMQKHQLDVCGYVYENKNDPGEIIVEIGKITATRGDLACLANGDGTDGIEGFPLSRRAIIKDNMEDAANEVPVDKLLANYAEDYMNACKQLKYIYIPIKEYSKQHWYLAVACLAESEVYYFDSNMCALEKIFISKYFKTIQFDHPTNLGEWDILDAAGVPNRGHSRDSVIWVMQWMEMGSKFTSVTLGHLNEERVRLNSALELLTENCNSKRQELLVRAEQWRKLSYGQT